MPTLGPSGLGPIGGSKQAADQYEKLTALKIGERTERSPNFPEASEGQASAEKIGVLVVGLVDDGSRVAVGHGGVEGPVRGGISAAMSLDRLPSTHATRVSRSAGDLAVDVEDTHGG